jgi:hypothetical protein
LAGFATVLGFLLAQPHIALGQNLLLNPSFESGTTGILATSTQGSNTQVVNWAFTTGTRATNLVQPSPTNVSFDGSRYINFGGGGAGPGGILSQTFTAVQGQQYTASLYVTYVGTADGSSIGFSVFDVTGNAVVQSASFVSGSTLTTGWVQQSFTFTAPSTSLSFRIQDLTTALQGAGTDVRADLASVSAIPEPSTYAAIFGAAALGFAVWRRRRGAAAAKA